MFARIAGLIVVSLVSAAQATSLREMVRITNVDGYVALVPKVQGDIKGEGWAWFCNENGFWLRMDGPVGTPVVEIRGSDGAFAIEQSGWPPTQVYRVSYWWNEESAACRYVVRIAVPDPDPVFTKSAEHIALLFLRNDHVKQWFEAILRRIDPDFKYDMGESLRVQFGRKKVTPRAMAWIEARLPLLDHPDFRVRDRAAGEMEKHAEAMRSFLNRPLSPQQRLMFDVVLRRHPLLGAEDMAALADAEDQEE